MRRFFSAINGEMTISDAVEFAFAAGYRITGIDGDRSCYRVERADLINEIYTPSQITCIRAFRQRQQKTQGLNLNMITPHGAIVVPQDDPTPPRAA